MLFGRQQEAKHWDEKAQIQEKPLYTKEHSPHISYTSEVFKECPVFIAFNGKKASPVQNKGSALLYVLIDRAET